VIGAFSVPAGGSQKAYRRGTHRVVPPEQTLARVSAFAREIGITRVANITGLDDVGIPVAQAVRPNSRSLSVSQGKGLTVAAAKASALMESVETYLAERIDRPVLIASYEDLVERRPVVDPGALPRLAGSKFQPGLKIAWIDGHNLFDQAAIWVPYEMVHTDWSVPLPQGSGCFPATSNGLASGNTGDEALVHAMAEVIERDGVALWHALDESGQAARRVDPGTVYDPDCQWLLDRFDRAGIDVAIWDLTTDLAVPTFRVHTLDRGDGFRSAQPAGGSGCHPDPAVALSRALTEAAQSRVTYISGARDDAGRSAYLDRRDEATKAAARRYFRQPLSRSFGDISGHAAESVDADLEWMLTRLEASGVRQVIALDLSQPAYPVSAVRVIVPGLEGVCTMPTYTPGARASASHD
jgi:ribosomal protein S12 methylthiotransferase accessory factor